MVTKPILFDNVAIEKNKYLITCDTINKLNDLSYADFVCLMSIIYTVIKLRNGITKQLTIIGPTEKHKFVFKINNENWLLCISLRWH